jgi:signal transduction histidine kinase
LSGFAATVTILGFILAVPLLVHAQADFCSAFIPMRLWQRLAVGVFYLPAIFLPWIVGRLLSHPGLEPLVAIGLPLRWLVVWAMVALLYAAGINLFLLKRRRTLDPILSRFHGYLAGLQGLLAFGITIAYLPHRLPPLGGLGGYFPTGLMLLGVLPSAMLGYSILRYNFLGLRVQRNVYYSVAAIFGFLLYLNFMRRTSGWLEAHGVLPAAVTEGVMIFVLVVLVEPVKRIISRSLRRQFISEFEKVQKLATEIEECAKRTGDVEALRQLVEERVPRELEFESARLHWAPAPRRAVNQAPQGTYYVPVSRGGEQVAHLEVVSASPMASGEQIAAIEMLADRLAAALELCRMIAEKVTLERELAAKERMAFLGEMAARIAHNVKNPLSGMKTIVQLMQENQRLPEEMRPDCQMLVAEIDRLNRNISQVLRYAKPARDIDQPADLSSVVRRVVALMRGEAEQRRLILEVSDSGPCWIEGGEEAASDIVSNLLVNALEASSDGGTVRIKVAQAPGPPDGVEFSIEDQGSGIPKDKLDKIFLPFFTTRAGGTGLGLAIVKRRVDEAGGSVVCQSPANPDGASLALPGTRFIVRFREAHSAPVTSYRPNIES